MEIKKSENTFGINKKFDEDGELEFYLIGSKTLHDRSIWLSEKEIKKTIKHLKKVLKKENNYFQNTINKFTEINNPVIHENESIETIEVKRTDLHTFSKLYYQHDSFEMTTISDNYSTEVSSFELCLEKGLYVVDLYNQNWDIKEIECITNTTTNQVYKLID